MCFLVGTVADKVALFSTFKALTGLSIFFAFFVIGSFADNSRYIHSIIVLRGKTWSRGLCAISLSAPILIVRSRVVATRATPDPSRSLSLSLSLSMTGIESPILRMKRFYLQIDLLLTLDCGSPLFISLRIFHLDICVSK